MSKLRNDTPEELEVINELEKKAYEEMDERFRLWDEENKPPKMSWWQHFRAWLGI